MESLSLHSAEVCSRFCWTRCCPWLCSYRTALLLSFSWSIALYLCLPPLISCVLPSSCPLRSLSLSTGIYWPSNLCLWHCAHLSHAWDSVLLAAKWMKLVIKLLRFIFKWNNIMILIKANIKLRPIYFNRSCVCRLCPGTGLLKGVIRC